MHNIAYPTTLDTSTLWSYEQAVETWRRLESFADYNDPTTLALESLLHAHAPTSTVAIEGTYASCNGDCYGDGHREIPKPWPCPAIMPILYPLGVERRPVV